MSEEKGGSGNLVKLLLTIVLPLITAIATANYQYVVNRWESSDQNYRELVSQLTLKDKNQRHAAAASIGTYLNRDSRYFHETIDILATRVSSESNYSVRNSIISSLKKIKDEPEYTQVINQLLTIVRNNFIQDYQMKTMLDKSRREYESALAELKAFEHRQKEQNPVSSQIELDLKKKQVSLKEKEFLQLQQEYQELQFNIPMVSNMISIFLSETKESEIDGLEFFRSNMNNVVITDLQLKNTSIKWAAFSSSTIDDSVLTYSKVDLTYFTWSSLKNVRLINSRIKRSLFINSTLNYTDFSGSTFNEVYFAGADLRGANFRNVSGLKAEYFYGAINLDKAVFDNPAFIDEVSALTPEAFSDLTLNSDLSADMRSALHEAVYGPPSD